MTRRQAISKANKLTRLTKLAACVVWYPGMYYVVLLDVALEMVQDNTLEETRIIHRTTAK